MRDVFFRLRNSSNSSFLTFMVSLFIFTAVYCLGVLEAANILLCGGPRRADEFSMIFLCSCRVHSSFITSFLALFSGAVVILAGAGAGAGPFLFTTFAAFGVLFIFWATSFCCVLMLAPTPNW